MGVWSCLREGVSAFTRRLRFLLGAWLIIYAIQRLLLVVVPSEYLLVQAILQAVILAPLYAGQYLLALKAVRNEPVRFSEFLDGFVRVWPVVGASLLVSIAVSVGLLLFVIPGLVWAMMFAFSPILLVDRSVPRDRPIGAIESLYESAQRTKGHRWTLFGVAAILSIPTLVYMALAYGMVYYPELIWLPRWGLELLLLFSEFLFLGPVYATSFMVVYDRATRRVDEPSTD